MEFIVKSKTQNLNNGEKGQTVYYAHPKMNRHVTTDELIRRIVEATSLTRGDVMNALISLSAVVCDELANGSSVDLAELGRLRLVVRSKMVSHPEEVTADNVLKTPKVMFYPKKAMLQAAKRVKLSIDHSVGVVEAGKR